MTYVCSIPITCAAALLAGSASASVLTNYNQNWEGWQAAAGTYTTCDFTGIQPLTLLTDQYEDSGVVFPSEPGTAWTASSSTWYPQDGSGFQSFSLYIEMTFAQPMHAIGMHVALVTHIALFSGDTLIGSQPFQNFPQGFDVFTGLVSSVAFDRVRIGPNSIGAPHLLVDNLYFSTIPAPAGVGLFFAAMMRGGRRRGR